MTQAQNTFLKYIRTKMIFTLRLRGEDTGMKPVFISSSEVERRFFPFPKYNRKKDITDLIDCGELLVIDTGKGYLYQALKAGAYDLSLLQIKPIPKTAIYKSMLENLKKVSLSKDAPSTGYFDLFLKYKGSKPELFFTVDDFCGRVHTPISNFHRTHRPNILINNQETTSLDVATMQPVLLGKILSNSIGSNEYSTWINEGKDIYFELQHKANLKTRDEAKKKFFEILFSKPSNALKALFGSSDWINWINKYKQANEPRNPHNVTKQHSNLAWLLQTTEVEIMTKIWNDLIEQQIPFLSVHDEIIIQKTYMQKTESIMHTILTKEFPYYKICGKS